MLLLFSWGWILLILAYAAWADMRTRIIPNTLIVVGFIGLFLLQLLNQETQWNSLFIGMAVGFGLWGIKFIGGGDSKLLMLVSMAFPPSQLIMLYTSITLVGAIQSAYAIGKKEVSIAYGGAIFMGTVATLIYAILR